MSEKYVYFAIPKDATGPVKIGCSRFPLVRLEQFRRWSPVPLEIVAMVPGDFAVERKLHAIFQKDRLHFEWFATSPRLAALLEALRQGVALADAIDLDAAPRSYVAPQYWAGRARKAAERSAA